MKKLLIFAMILLMLTSCTNAPDTVEPDPEEPVTNPAEEDEEPESVRYTGEIITDGFHGKVGRFYFIPDKETRELLKGEYPWPIEAGESIPLDYHDSNLIKELPLELGVYKVEVEADFSSQGIISELKSIKLTDEIGTVEYEGKTYPTNELDEAVTAKDIVCGLIVSNVRKFEDGAVMIEFEGEIESEGFYNLHHGGEFYNYINIGRIVPDGESVNNFPTYKGVGVHNNYSVYFTETNELYQQIAEHSAIGRGKFKTTGYDIVYNYGGGVPPDEVLTEIISLDERYKGMFEFNEDAPVSTMRNEKNKFQDGFMDKYAIACVYNHNDNGFLNEYYFLGKEEISKIKILSTDEFYYGLKESEDNNPYDFILRTDSSIENAHSISFRYGKSEDGKDLIRKNYSYGYFRDGDEIVRIFEGDTINDMTAKSIGIQYSTTEDSPDELFRLTCEFMGEITLTGRLTSYFDEGYGYNKLYFIADEEGIRKLPIHDDDIRKQGSIHFDYENSKEIIGTDYFEKNCEITIDNYVISKSAGTESYDEADLISVNFFE